MDNITKLTDEQLVDMVRLKDPNLFSHIIDRYQDKLFRYVNYLAYNYDLSADVVQETFISAFTNLFAFNTKKKFSSWIYRIAHNKAVNHLKKQHRQLPLLEDMDLKSDVDLEEDQIRLELKKRTHTCLSQLPVNYSEPLTLYYLEDKTYQEISDILRLPINTVGTRISRAKIYLKKICQKITR